ncbi:MAG: trypsin-like peptidase domain-containing protein [Thermoanaerobaculales bacterium]|nr:trypsin-like peptidase domain-containing protein [Thermoanaerobaculales bacterium]
MTGDEKPTTGQTIGAIGAEDVLLFKVCVAAIWSDGAMAAAERDHLSHLMDLIADTEDERHELRRIALHDVSRSSVLAEVDALEGPNARRLYERCLDVLTSDRRLRRGEIAFVEQLRRRSGIGAVRHQATMWRAAKWRRLRAVAAALALVVAGVMVIRSLGNDEELHPPVELDTHSEILLPQAAAGEPAMAPEALFEAIRRSVVKVNVLIDEATVGHGSGAVLGMDAVGQLYILTNRHVVFHAVAEPHLVTYELELENGIQLPAILDFYSKRHDLAVVVAPGMTGWGLPVPLRLCSDLQVGETVHALGSPIGLNHSFTSGVISALRGNMVQTDATVHSGSSGGPLFDTRGRVCGVVTTSHLQKDFSFALCGETVLDMLDERRTVE